MCIGSSGDVDFGSTLEGVLVNPAAQKQEDTLGARCDHGSQRTHEIDLSFVALCIVVALCGCATTSAPDEKSTLREIGASPHTFAVCRGIDTVTTIAIIHHGGVELNGVMATVIHIGYPAFVLVEALVVYSIYKWHHNMQSTNGEKTLVNAVGCIPGVWNATQLPL